MDNEKQAIKFAKIINDNANSIFSVLSQQDIQRYDFIMDTYRQGDITKNTQFMRAFKAYYIMRYTSKRYIDKFFRVMEELKHVEKPDLGFVSRPLYSIDERHELSFITKMMHTRFDNYPIFDKFVCKFFGFKRPDGSIENKILESQIIIDTMSATYAYIKEQKAIQATIDKFDVLFPNNISFEKKIDFLIWAYGKAQEQVVGYIAHSNQLLCKECKQVIDTTDFYCRHCGVKLR